MTPPPSMSAPRPGPLGAVAVVSVVIAAAAWVLALVRPWGDTGVDPVTGALRDVRPAALLAGVAVVVVVGGLVAVAAVRTSGRLASARSAALAGALVIALAGVALVAVLAVTTAQVFPRDGGWWAIVAVVGCGIAGLAIALSGTVRPTASRALLVSTAVAFAVPVALVVAAGVVAPGWSAHVVDGSYPASFSESAGPTTVTRVGWRASYGADTVVAVLGGRVVVASDSGGGADDRGCRLSVKALDAGTGRAVWSSSRTLRCNGPRLAGLDGNNTTVRLTLRGFSGSGKQLEGARASIYLGLEDGRGFTPSAALDDVQWWTEGFGLVADGSSVRGLDARTGATVWTRPLPTCADGRAAALQLPAALPAGELAGRSPYDLGTPHGVAPVTGAGNDVVLGTSCPESGTTVRRVWLVDTVRGPGSDHTATLPTVEQLAGAAAGAGAGAAAADVDTGFLPWLDTVVAAVPVSDPGLDSVDAALVGIDLASGRILWQRAPAQLATVDLSPVDGSVQVSSSSVDFRQPTTTVLDVRTGTVLAEHDDASPPETSVALVGGRVQYSRADGITVVDPKTGAPTGTPFAGCPPDRTSTAAPMLAGPGGVVLRCLPTDSSGPSVMGLAP